MLSTENPSCSSSSSKPSPPSDLVLATTGSDDHHHHHPNPPPVFSIRDYVLKSRSKDVRINWPFRQQLLNRCLDNGVDDLLPPLESPGLVRSYCYRLKDLGSKHLIKFAKNKSVVLGDGERASAALVSTEEKVQQDSSSGTSHDILSGEGIFGEQLKRNCGSDGIESSVREVLASNSGAVSDPMASKVCPVCKSFTSTSNTTLNAHIDQCLSSDQCDVMRDVSEFPKTKVKPKKKRLMVDIYMTAPHSTLEDLDRRNGTNWAVSLAVVASPPTNDLSLENRRTNLSCFDAASVDEDVNLEPRRTKMPPSDAVIVDDDSNLEAKRMKLSTVDATSEGNVGDIYIDSNGTKLLILSRFDDSPPLVSRKKFTMKKHGKVFKSGRGCSINKKELLKEKRSEFMDNIPPNKKLNVFKGFRHEIEAETEEYHISEDHHQEREESGSPLQNAHAQVKSGELSSLGHWVCSKRSDLSRKQANKDNNRGSEKIIVTPGKLSFKRTQPASDHSSIQQRCVLNLASFPEAAASPKTRCTNILSNDSRCMDSGKKRDLRSSNLNSKFLGYDYLEDDHMPRMSCPTETPHPSLKARKSSTSKKTAFPRRTCIPLEEIKVDKGKRLIAPRKFKKHRSILSCTKGRGSDKHYKVNLGCDSSSEDFCPISSDANEASEIHDQSDLSADQEKGSLDLTDPVRSTVTGAPGNDANLDLSTDEQVESLSRDETLVEELIQRSIHDDERQCQDTVNNKVDIGHKFHTAGDHTEQMADDGEVQTETTTPQEPNARVTTHGEIVLDTIRENSLTNLVRTESSYQDHHMILDMESSGSAVSAASAISPASPVDDRIKDPVAECLAEHNPWQDKMSSPLLRKDNNVKLSPPPRERSCCCSESLSRESQLLNHKKSAVSNLFIKPPAFSFGEPLSSLESHTESVVTTDPSKSVTNASTPCSGTQSASNPILRLMGKDLFVGKEESTQMPTILPCDAQAKFISFASPSNVGFIGYHNPYSYQIQTFANHQVPFQPLQVRSDRLNPPSPWGMERMIAPQHHRPRSSVPSHPTQEVIVIDDDTHGVEPEPRTKYPTLLPAVHNPNLMAPQRLFACFPPPSPYAPRAFVPSQREASEGAFLFPSPSSLYFSPTLR